MKHKNIIESMKENIAGGVINIQYWSEALTMSSLGNIFNALRLAKLTRTGYYLTESDDIVSNAMTRLQNHGIENVMHVELEQLLNIWDDDIVCLLKNIIRRYYHKSKSL
ncbi:MAG: hypothetical protein ACFE9L_13700 [Candidatus Hodarchaeota archaeon]